MNFKIIRSAQISIKLTVIYAFMFSFVLLLLNASILYGVRYYLYEQAGKTVEGIKTVILDKVQSEAENANLNDKDLLSDIPPRESIFVKVLYDNKKISDIPNKFNYNINITEPFDQIKHVEEQEKHLIYENVKLNSKENGLVYVQIVKDMGNEYHFIKVLYAFMAIADFLGIAISILLGYVISKRMLRPIDNITKAAQNISISNLKERIDIKGPEDELKRLANTFNSMIDRLQDAFERQVQFVSDASHELRTPIAVIGGYANLLDRWGKDDREALEKSIKAIKVETSNMAVLVEKLLFLAKGDSGTIKVEKKKIWINELIGEVVEETKIIAPKHSISNDKNDKACVFADYKMLKQMLRIFIDNSIKFTPEKGRIDISSVVQGKVVNIIVSDTGIGIPKEEIGNIFSRFYRVEKSRSKEMGGNGLGLSIAKEIAEMHQGTITVESKEGRGTKITVTLSLQE